MNAALPAFWPKFTRFRGDTKRLRLKLTDDNGAILNPDEHSLFLDVDGTDGAPLIQKSSAIGGFTTADAPNGLIDVELVPADDALLVNDTPYDGVVVAVHLATDARHRIRFTLTLVDGLVDEPAVTIPTSVINPAPTYLTAAEIEANRARAETAAQTATDQADRAIGALNDAFDSSRIATEQATIGTEQAVIATEKSREATTAAQQTAADRQATAQNATSAGNAANAAELARQASAENRDQTGLDRAATETAAAAVTQATNAINFVLATGTDAERLAVALPLGVLVFTTDTKKLWAGDGVTFGGVVPF